MIPLASCHQVEKSFNGRQLFANLGLTIADSDRIGLIGANGSGKSTLLKILSGLEHPDSGSVSINKKYRLVYLPQEDAFDPGARVDDVVFAALASQELDETERQVRGQRALRQAGFVDLGQRVAQLSGGWRKRLALARALAQAPDLLLLDEPTNHLDLEGILWLEGVLARASFAFVLVTHDRYFLERSTNAIVELSRRHPEGVLRVAGHYSDFLVEREARLALQQQLEATQANRVRREIEWLRRGVKARTTKAQARIDEAGRLIEELQATRQRTADERKLALDFESSGRRTKRLLWANGLRHGFGSGLLLDDVDVLLAPGTRLGLVGSNGTGKTTLLKILAGELTPLAGQVERAPQLRLQVFEQDRSTLDPQQSLRRALAPEGDSVVYHGTAQHIVGWASRFLFKPAQLDLPVGELSGGEQARIIIARLMLQPADVLLLDEPTNDLDIPSLEVLEESLLEFDGALVLVTHDRFLLDRVCTQVLGLGGDGRAIYCADVEQWLQQNQPAPKASKAPPAPRLKTATSTKLTFKEQREFEQLEAAIPGAEAELRRLHNEVQRPEVCSAPLRLRDCVQALEAAQQQLDQMYKRWEELATRREQG